MKSFKQHILTEADKLGKVFNGLKFDTSDMNLFTTELLDVYSGEKENIQVMSEVYILSGETGDKARFMGLLTSNLTGKPSRVDVLYIDNTIYPSSRKALESIEKWYYKNRNKIISKSIPNKWELIQ